MTANMNTPWDKFDSWIFDLDGTLIDSVRDIAISVNILRESLYLPEKDIEELEKNVGWGVKVLIEKSIPERDDTDTLVKEFKQIYRQNLLVETKTFDGTVELLQLLLKAKKKIFLLSNKPEELCVEILKGLNLDHYFQEIIGGDRFPKPKPDTSALAYLQKTYNLDKESMLFIGDSQVDEDTAKNFALNFVRLRNYSIQQENYFPSLLNFLQKIQKHS